MNFEDLGLSAELLRAVHDQGYTTPTPIQEKAIPLILAGRDMFGGAQTGTGKTAAFTLPLLQRLGAGERPKGRRRVRALVLTPTRELAAQVQDSIRTYGKRLPFSSTVVFGGVNIGRQKDQLARGVDILVATPGRLLDLVGQRSADLGGVEILVLDEADRMLDMGFIHDIRKILALLPAERQNLLFSATYSPEIRKLASAFMHDPASVDVAPRNTTAEKVGQVAYLTRREGKREVLSKLIREGDWKQVLVFTRTKHGANRLSTQLENDGIQASAIHGNKSQAARTRALSDFKRGKVRVLVATDIAARGLDIELLPHVVNYEIPNVPEDYVHRIGRTGRAGAVGEAVSLVCVDERKLLWDIEKLLGGEIEKRVMEGHEPDPKETPRPIPGMGKPGGGGRGQGRPNNRPPNNGRGQRQGAGGRSGPSHGRPGGGRPGGRPAGRASGGRPGGRQRTGR